MGEGPLHIGYFRYSKALGFYFWYGKKQRSDIANIKEGEF
jgi:hypothetical protein